MLYIFRTKLESNNGVFPENKEVAAELKNRAELKKYLKKVSVLFKTKARQEIALCLKFVFAFSIPPIVSLQQVVIGYLANRFFKSSPR